jgi:shikimate dehydrogenase
MDHYCLFGHPVSHSWSPFIHGLFAQQTGQDMDYGLRDSTPDSFRIDLLDFFVRHQGRGCNVTLPHKRAAASAVHALTPRARLAGAVNTIVLRGSDLLGDNTDGAGLVTDLRDNVRVDVSASRILMMGAGGAARGALAPLLELRPGRLVIANRTAARAVALAREFEDLGPVVGTGFEAPELDTPFDLIINATSAGLEGMAAPVKPSAVGPGSTCYDMFYAANETPFARWARELGARRVVQGWGMLVEQAAEAFELWRGVRPSTQPVLAALQAKVAAKAAATTTASHRQ